MLNKFRYAILGVIIGVTLLLPTTVWATDYDDINGHWAAVNIVKANEMEWVKGYENKTFRPDNSVTRAEFVAFVDRVFPLDSESRDENNKFQDIPPTAWYANVVNQARENGLLEIYDQKFLADTPITREEAVEILSEAKNRFFSDRSDWDKLNEGSVDINDIPFTDKEQISDDCLRGVINLYKQGYLAGYQGW